MTIDLVQQASNAFDFLEKLYLETSCLIKETEGILSQEPEEFVILKPGGYTISTRISKGLGARDVLSWLLADGVVFFCQKEMVSEGRTEFHDNLRVLFLRVELRPSKGRDPKAVMGYIEDIQLSESKRNASEFEYFEKLAQIFAERGDKILSKRDDRVIHHEDSYWTLRGEFVEADLFGITGTDDIMSRLLTPILQKVRVRMGTPHE